VTTDDRTCRRSPRSTPKQSSIRRTRFRTRSGTVCRSCRAPALPGLSIAPSRSTPCSTSGPPSSSPSLRPTPTSRPASSG